MGKNIDLDDYSASRKIVQNEKLNSNEYDKVYYMTNEDLVDVYSDMDFRGKDVLSVLASSDQVLTARFLDAKTVDAFDKNRLTIYYFYLRLWSIKYYKELYPPISEPQVMKDLLRQVIPRNQMEEKALIFFQKHLEEGSNLEFFFHDEGLQPMGYTLFSEARELEKCLSPELSFTRMDMFERQEVTKQYDIILMSNILDWAWSADNSIAVLKAARNLSKMTRKNGVVICSNLIYRQRPNLQEERSIFSSDFELEENDYSYNYVYHKK